MHRSKSRIRSRSISSKPEVPGFACILQDRTLPWAVPTMNFEDIVGSKERLQTPSALSGSVKVSSRATSHSRVAFPKFLMSHHLQICNASKSFHIRPPDSAILRPCEELVPSFSYPLQRVHLEETHYPISKSTFRLRTTKSEAMNISSALRS